ncbi:MSS1 tRNA modification GTPase MSS1 [Candida maltosa Xu316]|uniref:TrmE-type G domain-containing protein n=1 Tax=Candida maltosa (strain Xu316) TaxID=1245528 RepID=M3HU01_CANMX|nr:hypothetical protein G210_1258 [Candida maltosa Xu316]
MFRRFLSTTTSLRPTVFALSTKFGKSAIAVVRISGPQSQYIYHELTKSTKPPKDRIASVRKLYSTIPHQNTLLDEALTLYLPGPKTYTGEDLLELHLHGGIAIIKAVLSSIKTLHNPEKGIIIRQADRGEFSRQAFINGRLDLTELEGINNLIDSETEQQRLANLSSSSGKTKEVFQKWRKQILDEIANLTTIIDFGEDHDLHETENLINTVISNIKAMDSDIRKYLKKVRSSEVLLNGIKLTLLGPPNAGKSSILNILANKDAAIVSEIAGTTRDVLDIPLEIGGFKVVVGDTAGIRASEEADVIEREGIKRAKERSFLSDLVIVILDPLTQNDTKELKNHINELIKENKKILVVLNKQDLYLDKADDMIEEYSKQLNLPQEYFHVVSCSTGQGVDNLLDVLVDSFKNVSESIDSDPVLVSARIQDILENDILYGFSEFYQWAKQDDVVVATECLTQSVDGIGKITGEYIDLDEVLDVVFSNFCIGK